MTRQLVNDSASGAVPPVSTSTETQQARRRSFRYGLRSLLVFVALVAAWLGWIAHRGHVQQQAVAIITQSGGSVEYDDPSVPVWLTRLAGKDCFCSVWKVDLSGTKVTDAELVHLKPLTRLHTVNLAGTKVTDSGLRHLRTFRELRWVRLERTAVSDRGASELRRALPHARVYLEDPAKAHLLGFEF